MAAQWLHMDLQLFQDENEAVNLHTVCMDVKFVFCGIICVWFQAGHHDDTEGILS